MFLSCLYVHAVLSVLFSLNSCNPIFWGWDFSFVSHGPSPSDRFALSCMYLFSWPLRRQAFRARERNHSQKPFIKLWTLQCANIMHITSSSVFAHTPSTFSLRWSPVSYFPRTSPSLCFMFFLHSCILVSLFRLLRVLLPSTAYRCIHCWEVLRFLLCIYVQRRHLLLLSSHHIISCTFGWWHHCKVNCDTYFAMLCVALDDLILWRCCLLV